MIEKDLLFDKRIIDRNVARGRVTQAALKEHKKTMKDLSAKATVIHVEVRRGEFKVELPEPEE
jgi:hypothetical protein